MRKVVGLLMVLAVAGVPAWAELPDVAGPVPAGPEGGDANPVAVNEATYQAFGRVFSDPHGCLPDTGEVLVSPWAKGDACAVDYLTYEEVVAGTTFFTKRFDDLAQLIRLDEAYEEPDFRSAGIARAAGVEDGDVRAFARDRSPLYMVKVTNEASEIPESERAHFVYSLSIHGLERAGLEGGIRAMEDLVTWAACEDPERAGAIPACETDGPFPKRIVESDTERPVPTAGEVLDRAVIYFVMPNVDGWRLGQKRSPVEFRDGGVNASYLPGPSYLRGNGHGVDLNRDWPEVGYTQRSHQPGSEPETRAFMTALRDVRDQTAEGRFAAGIDLHGMNAAYAFSYTLIGAGQRDYQKNAITVETSLRTWEDQTQRLRWSPWVADSSGTGTPDDGEPCVQVLQGGTRDAAPSCVADEWGTIFDTLGYTVSGAFGNWMDSPLGLDGVGINNEMALSNLAPNTIFEPSLVQTHIDGNKGLIYSQISALLFEQEAVFEPTGTVAYVFDPTRLQVDAAHRAANPGLPAQPSLDVLLPCEADLPPQVPGSCGEGTFAMDGADLTYTYEVRGVDDGFWNGGMTVTSTTPQQGVGAAHLAAGVVIERFDPAKDGWSTESTLSRTSTTLNDPQAGTWRIRFAATSSAPRRVQIDFDPHSAEEDPGQLAVDVSVTDFYTELNASVPAGSELVPIDVKKVAGGPGTLRDVDTLIVTDALGDPDHLRGVLGLSDAQVDRYVDALAGFAASGGTLVLTDAALGLLAPLGVVAEGDVRRFTGLAGFYSFQIDSGGAPTYTDPDRYPLAAGLDLDGAAEERPGRRQAVEPTPLGYNPNNSGTNRRMPFWGVEREAWEAACGRDDCTVATTQVTGSDAYRFTNLGEATFGDGRIRIAGALLPPPNFAVDDASDTRFGLASYALTYTAYEVFENLLDAPR